MFNNVLLQRMCRLIARFTPLSGSLNTGINQLTLLDTRKAYNQYSYSIEACNLP